MRLNAITPQACREWSAKLITQIACHYHNNTLGTLKQVLAVGIKAHKANGGGTLENPAADVKKTRVKQKELRLPEPAQFKELVANVRKRSGGWGPRDGDLVEFLAYSGLRIQSEAVWVTGEDIHWTRKEIIVRGDLLLWAHGGWRLASSRLCPRGVAEYTFVSRVCSSSW